jgi:hypothetical protein
MAKASQPPNTTPFANINPEKGNSSKLAYA